MGDKKFYMTYSRDRPNELVPWIEEHNVPLLENAMHRWSDSTDSFMDMWEYDTEQVIDAGGYNVQGTYADRYGNIRVDESEVREEVASSEPFYPWTVEEYHSWLAEHYDTFEWATVMDYACEERFDSLWSVEERVEATIDNTIKHFNQDPDYNVLPVLQGRSIEDYIRSYDTLKDHGIPVDTIGLGTICRLSSTEEIIKVENEVRERVDADTIHGFGVKVDSFDRGANFDTADSAAWVYGASNGKIYLLDEDDGELRKYEMDEDSSLIRTVESFKSYYAYVTYLKSGESQVPVEPRLEFAEEYKNGDMTEEGFRERWV
jgi:hypothetical protein